MMSSIEQQLQQGVKAHVNGNLRAAESAYRAVLALDPENATAHNNLGFIYGQQQRWDDALLHLRTALEKDPRSSMAHSNLGQVLAAQGCWRDGLEHLEKAVALNPDNAQAWENLGRICLLAGNAERAEYAWERALKLGDRPPAQLLVKLGTAVAAQQRFEEALNCYRRALEFEPDNADAWAQIGIARLLRKDYGSSQDALRRALALRPDDAGVMKHLGMLAVARGDTADGMDWYRAALERAPRDAELRLEVAVLRLSRGQAEQALAELDGLLDAGLNNEKADYYRGLALRELGQYDEARRQLHQVVESGGHYAERAAALLDQEASTRAG